MSHVGLVTHHHRDQAVTEARDLAAWVRGEAGHTLRLTQADAEILGVEGEIVDESCFADGLDLVVTLGGDGSILRAVDLIGDRGVPVLGVNLGELGYLAAVEPHDVPRAIKRFFDGDHQVQERMMVQVTVRRAGGGQDVHHALNDMVVERGATSTSVRIAVSIDGEYFHTYAVDGLIVATPTGSTAYSMSARGPIVAADHRALLLTPVSPHQLFDRSLVLEPTSTVDFAMAGHREARLSVDGRILTSLGAGDLVHCTASPRTARLVTFGRQNFHQILKAKFGLHDRSTP